MSKSENQKQIPLWGRIISWVLGTILLIVALIGFIMATWSFGTSMFNDIQQYGVLMAIGVFAIGIFALGFSIIVLSFVIAVIRRITKWKWLQIPME